MGLHSGYVSLCKGRILTTDIKDVEGHKHANLMDSSLGNRWSFYFRRKCKEYYPSNLAKFSSFLNLLGFCCSLKKFIVLTNPS